MGDLREDLGKVVREAWVAWAKEQPEPKPSWLVPYEQLSKADQDADIRIAMAVIHYFHTSSFGMKEAILDTVLGIEPKIEKSDRFDDDYDFDDDSKN